MVSEEKLSFFENKVGKILHLFLRTIIQCQTKREKLYNIATFKTVENTLGCTISEPGSLLNCFLYT